MANYTNFLMLTWGITMTLFSLSYIFIPSFKFRLLKFIESPSSRWFFMFLNLTIGIFHISFHNDWTLGNELLITLIGWAALVKGIAILIFPNTLALGQRILQSKYYPLVITFALIFGLYFINQSINFKAL